MLVVDASALAALLFGEPDGPAIEFRLRRGEPHAPVLIRYELANVFLKKARRFPAMRDQLFNAFRLFDDFAIELHDVDLMETLALAERHSLSAYDASYLWLARELGVELVTLDARLGAALR